MLEKLIIDSSTLIALERADIISLLDKLDCEIIISESVFNEVGNALKSCKRVKIEKLKGRSIKKSRSLEKIGLGKGEAECIALALRGKLSFIVCDDRKLIRQIFFSRNSAIKNIKILGFSFILHEFYKKNLINDVWRYFEQIVEKCNWNRSEVQIANYTFLKEIGY